MNKNILNISSVRLLITRSCILIWKQLRSASQIFIIEQLLRLRLHLIANNKWRIPQWIRTISSINVCVCQLMLSFFCLVSSKYLCNRASKKILIDRLGKIKVYNFSLQLFTYMSSRIDPTSSCNPLIRRNESKLYLTKR